MARDGMMPGQGQSHLGVRRVAPVWLALALAASAVAIAPAVADAHAFLVRTAPQAGERLEQSPAMLTLQFSEPVVPGAEELSVRTADGRPVALPWTELATRRTAIRAAFPDGAEGAYVVSWRVLAEDGHVEAGEFAFGVGPGGRMPVAAGVGSTQIPWPDAAATWLLLGGLVLAIGGLLSEAAIWGPVARARALTVPQAPVAVGLWLSLLGAALQFALLAGARVGGGLTTGLDWRALGAALWTRPGLLQAAAAGLVAYALWLLPLRRLRAWALLPLAGAIVATAARGHSGTAGVWWAVPANALHLAAAGLWAGALVHLVLVLSRLDREEWRPTLGEAARRYARVALVLVAAVVGGGVATALAMFDSPADLLETAYGRVLLLKLLLVAAALALALIARRRALPANPRTRLPLLRRLTRAEAAALVAVIGASAILANVAPPRSAAALAELLGPAPLSGPVLRLASLAGQLGVYLAAAQEHLEVQVITPARERAQGARLELQALTPAGERITLHPRSCAQGCFTMRFPWRAGTTRFEADVSAPGWTGGRVRFEVPWPPGPDAPELLERVVRTMRAQREVVLTEQTSSGPGATGPRNTARMTGAQFIALEPYATAGADDVRRLPGESLVLYLPGSYIWGRLWIDEDYRIRRAVIVSPGHLIERSFLYASREG